MAPRLCVVGLGLMGGSVGLAARERGAAAAVSGFAVDPAARHAAEQRGCVEAAHDDLAAALEGADLVLVCAPVAQLASAVAGVVAAAPTATVSDVGSTRAGLLAAVPAAERARFVGGHPMAGLELRGA